MTSQNHLNINENSSYLSPDTTLQKIKDELSEFLIFRKEENVQPNTNTIKNDVNLKLSSASDEKPELDLTSKATTKRKRKAEEFMIHELFDIFLCIVYPLSVNRSKTVSVGIVKSLSFNPHVIINHNSKSLFFNETSWESFLKHLHLFQCYLTNNVHGRKTAVRFPDSDIEVDSMKMRGVQHIRLKDLTKYDSTIQLNQEEFFVLVSATEAITRYLRQLAFAVPIIKDYLDSTTDLYPDTPIPASPLDTSIHNRLPQEVHLWREMKRFRPTQQETISEVQPHNKENEDEEEDEEEQQQEQEEVGEVMKV